MTSLAEYNNNPGNIRPAKGVNYDGMIGVDDKGFAVFEKPEHGQRALENDITHKIENRGIKTPEDFVNAYSPKGDENSEDARDNYKIYIAHQLGLNSTTDPFPENSVGKIATAVANFESGKWQEKPKDEGGDAPEAKASEDNKPLPPASNEPGSSEDMGYALVGAGTGLKVASGLETGKQALPLIQNALNKFTGSDAYMSRPQSRPSLQRYLASQIAPDLRLPLSEFEKVANNGNPVRTMSEVQDALKNIQAVPEQQITKPVYKPQAYGSKVLVDTGKVLPATLPGKPAVDLSAYKYTPTVGGRIADQAANVAEIAKGALPSAGRIGVGVLGGALAGKDLYDAYQQYQKEGGGWHLPSARNAAQWAGGVGGALATLPFAPTQIVGAALQAPELAYQGADWLAKHKQDPSNGPNSMLTNYDAMGSALP